MGQTRYFQLPIHYQALCSLEYVHWVYALCNTARYSNQIVDLWNGEKLKIYCRQCPCPTICCTIHVIELGFSSITAITKGWGTLWVAWKRPRVCNKGKLSHSLQRHVSLILVSEIRTANMIISLFGCYKKPDSASLKQNACKEAT